MPLSGRTGLENPDALFAPVQGETRLGLAVSGGPDSLALFILARDWAEKAGKKLLVYTVDHGLRSEAGRECASVAELAGSFGVEVRILTWNGEKPRSGVQARARTARYRLIGEAMRADGVGVLMTAHHLDDQAETVVMRLAHGSGLTGLSGMRDFSQIEGVTVFRPLLGVSKPMLETIVARAGLTPVRDPSNADLSYERVRWRRALAGLAEDGLTGARLAQFAARATRADRALEQQTDKAFAELADVSLFGLVRLDRAGLRGVPEEIAVRVLLRALRWAGGHTQLHALSFAEALAADLAAAGDVRWRTGQGAAVRARGDEVQIRRDTRGTPLADASVPAGESRIWDRRFRIENRSADWPLRVAPGSGITRHMAEAVLERKIPDPIAALRNAPVVWRADGQVIAIGGAVLSTEVQVTPFGLETL